MYVMGNCGGSWFNNTAGYVGGAVSLSDDSIISRGGEAIFAYNTAGLWGGALFVTRSTVSWTGEAKSEFNGRMELETGER